jgi:A20-like zinc finger
MISNYLAAARSRFEIHLKDKERRDNLQLQNGKIRCASPGCDFFGTATTNYLCPGCFNKQKVHLEEMKAQRETTTIGKSTFYANAKGDNSADLDDFPNNQRPLTPRGTLPQLQKPNAVVEECSTSDEDCVVKACLTPNCLFFGQEKTEFLCSQCFKQKTHVCRLPPASADMTNR